VMWALSHRFDPRAAGLADRHYSRQKPGTPQFMPSGRAFVLYAEDDGHRAVWGTSWPEHARHEWEGAWLCSIFRNEGFPRSHKLIRQAVAATLWRYGEAPSLGMITFVKEDAVRPKRDPGFTFIMAGFRPIGRTRRHGHLVLQLLPKRMPKPVAPRGAQMELVL